MSRKAKAAESETPKKPASLGTKHVCPKCSTKFYDFTKETGKCPKCGTMVNFAELKQAALASIVPTKKAKAKPVEDEEDTPTPAADVEAIEDLDDGPETSLQDLEVDDDDDEKEGDY